jgi:hypothetical protein
MDDEHAGLGGSYIIGEDGARRLVERTQEGAVEPDLAKRSKRKAPTEGDGGDASAEQKGE